MPYIIGIAGGSASGKTTFCKKLAESLNGLNLKVIHTDWYFKPAELLPTAVAPITGKEYPDHNHPNTLDLPRLKGDIAIAAQEFDVVIIPFCDWALCKSGKTLWLRPDEAPFSDMKLLPLKFDKDLRNTIFIKDYQREKMLSYIDNLNLLYVAFTRARKAMFISMPQQKKDDFIDVKNLIYRVFNQPISQNEEQKENRQYINLNEGWSSETMRYFTCNVTNILYVCV